MKKFLIFWLTKNKYGRKQAELVQGADIADACRKAGIGNGAISVIDYYTETPEVSHEAMMEKVQEAIWENKEAKELKLTTPICHGFAARQAVRRLYEMQVARDLGA